jgi:hypothetical protein
VELTAPESAGEVLIGVALNGLDATGRRVSATRRTTTRAEPAG